METGCSRILVFRKKSVMSKIQDYYDFIDKFKGDLKPRLQTELEQLEDSLIAEEILPAISESVAPVLGILRRHLTLVVD